jgi:putative ABC transport system permease protein
VLVVVAALIAFPAVSWVMARWLQGFAYRTETGPLGFLLAGLAALVIAWLAASYGALRAARDEPSAAASAAGAETLREAM